MKPFFLAPLLALPLMANAPDLAHAQPAAASTSTATPRFRDVLPRQQLSPAQQAELSRSLEGQNKQYDEAAKMLAKPFSSPGYHTKLQGGTVHPTRDAAAYALSLLDSGDAALEARALDVLRKVLSLQDTDPNSKTYGIWSWFLEEPLSQMAPPDWNWADFIGTQLLQIAINHRERLPADLQSQLDASIVHAARSIQKRNVGPSYTNIAIMGTHVTLAASDVYDLPDLHDYALKRLRTFADYTRANGGFTEYNSPTYTIVALEELARLRMHAREPEARKLADELYHTAWEEIAAHWHAPSGQWAGPHSRSYRTLLGDQRRIIERGLKNELDARLPLPIPDDLKPYFQSLQAPRTLAKTFTRGEAGKTPDLIGTTFLHPSFTLGSINWGEMWNQRRPLVAYWGTRDKPSYLALRFLHDGYDFSDAQFYSVQQEGRVLAGLALATDGGDTHVSLDRIQDATIKARDLRLRFEIGGEAASTWQAPQVLAEPLQLKFEAVSLRIALPIVRASNGAGRWETSRDKEHAFLDYVLYSGEEASINIGEMQEAALMIALQISATDSAWAAPTASAADGMLSASWGDLCLSIPSKPGKAGEMRAQVKFACP